MGAAVTVIHARAGAVAAAAANNDWAPTLLELASAPGAHDRGRVGSSGARRHGAPTASAEDGALHELDDADRALEGAGDPRAGVPGVDDHDLAGDVAGGVAAQERERAGLLVGL